jgi:lipooligosaccharide transport system permease protein
VITQLTISPAVAIAQQRAGHAAAGIYAGRAHTLIERSWRALRTTNALVFFSGFVEPVFYLLAFGFGVGSLVGGSSLGADSLAYARYIAPALLATSAMNGAITDATWNIFFKMHYDRVYTAMLATSLGPLDVALGEIAWALLRGGAYALGFMAVAAGFHLVTSWWALLAVPAAIVVAFAFAAAGMAATSYMHSMQQVQWLNFWLLPMFLFSGTFYPLSVYPEWLAHTMQVLPLWHAIELVRGAMNAQFTWSLLAHLLYFAAFIGVGLFYTTRRLTNLFLR